MVLYLCQITQVFEGLKKGIPEDILRAKFVSGLVASGLPPERDASLFFVRALNDAKDGGYITCKEIDHWRPGMASGSGWESTYELTLAGQRLGICMARGPFGSAAQDQNQEDQSSNASSTAERDSVIARHQCRGQNQLNEGEDT